MAPSMLSHSSPDPSVRSVPSAIAARTPRRRPIPESADGPWSRSKCRWHDRCAARRRSGAGPVRGRPPPKGWVFEHGASISHRASDTWKEPVVGGVAGPVRPAWRQPSGFFPSATLTNDFVFRIGSKSTEPTYHPGQLFEIPDNAVDHFRGPPKLVPLPYGPHTN